jgi:hypothetical protein
VIAIEVTAVAELQCAFVQSKALESPVANDRAADLVASSRA